ncbi:oxytocin receptor-like [Dermacentor andersoni]|uniref:oxytocin receptor-like n=1 Tax=Dermacentor andersoni TaxID=34620 RepID=UPI002155E4F1|nr:oxytocin receptor-like [Dermacentor andersoni]
MVGNAKQPCAMPDISTRTSSHAALQDSARNATFNLSSLQTTDIGNSSEESVFGPQYHSHVRITVIIIMVAFSIAGNCVVCWRLLRNHRRRRYQKAHILFLNLAVADLLVTTVTMTSQMVWEIMGRAWIAGDAFCRVFKVLQTFALASSTYMIVSIALDRHFAIVYPLAACLVPSHLAAGSWLASLIPSLPNLYMFRLVEASENLQYCASVFYARKADSPLPRQLYMTFVFLSVFVLPLILLVVLYGRILIEIWKQSSALKNRHQTASPFPKAKVKTIKLTAAIFIAFLVTNVPYMVLEMVLAFAGTGASLDQNMVALFGVISASNSTVNPYIFLFFQKSSESSKRKRFVMPFRKDAVAELPDGHSSCGNGGLELYPVPGKYNSPPVFALAPRESSVACSSCLPTEVSSLSRFGQSRRFREPSIHAGGEQ